MEVPPTDANPTDHARDMRRAARNISVLMLASIISKGVIFIWQIILSGLLSDVDYGVYSTVVALGAVAAPIVNFGIGLIAIREVSRKPQLIGRYWAAMLYTQTALFGVAYIGLVIGGLLVSRSAANPDILALTAIAGISLLIDVIGSISNDLLIAQERMTITAAVEIGSMLLRVALVAMAVLAGWGLIGLYAMTIASGVVRAVLLSGVHLRDGLRPQWSMDRSIVWGLLTNGWPLAINAIIAQVYDQSDKIMTTSIIGEVYTSYIGLAYTIKLGITELLSTTVVMATYPIMSRYHEEGDGRMFGFMVEKLARFMLLVSLPIALVFTVFAQPIVEQFLAEKYAPVAGILPIYMWYTVISMIGAIFARALLIQNKQRTALAIRVAGLMLNLVLNAILLFGFRDPRGVVIATLSAEALSLLLMMQIFQAPGFDWGTTLAGALRISLLGAASAVIMLLIGSLSPWLGIVAGLLVYAIGVMLLPVLHRDDWDLLYRVVMAMPGGTIIRRFWHRDIQTTT
ncbi:MAG: flippase [Anaerolineaceae bacterium]|nr:flippase [Anaerolineaceae bacterium]